MSRFSRSSARLLSIVALAVAATISPIRPVYAEYESPAKWLPASTAAYVEVADPTPVIDALLGDKVLGLIEQLEPYRKYRDSKDYKNVESVVGVLEAKLGTDWKQTLRKTIGGGVAAAFDPSRGCFTLVVRSRDAKLLEKLHAAIVELVEADAKNKGTKSPAKSEEYHGVVGWTFGKGEAHVLLGDTLIVTNNAQVLKEIVARRTAKGNAKQAEKMLADDVVFQTARNQVPTTDVGFGFVRLAPLRLAMGLANLLNKKSDNPVGELLAGGVIDALGKAHYLALGFKLDEREVRLAAHLPYDRRATAETRRWFFAPQAGAAAAPPLEAPNTVATLTAYRDVGGMWTGRNELFDEKTNVGFTEADTNLGLYFSGRDFGTQVLGELAPQWRFIAARREFGEDGQPVPALQLPAFGLVWELKHPDDFGPHLQLAFQNVIGITNLDGVQKGRPQLLLKSEQRGRAEIHYGTYLLVGDPPSADAPIHFNFRPACARVGKHFVVGTQVGLVRSLCDKLANQPSTAGTSESLGFEIRAEELAKVLAANRPLIIGRAMLSAGGDKTKAESQLNSGLKLLDYLESACLRLTEGDRILSLELGWHLRPQPAATR